MMQLIFDNTNIKQHITDPYQHNINKQDKHFKKFAIKTGFDKMITIFDKFIERIHNTKIEIERC